jgi:GLPGLI family protein
MKIIIITIIFALCAFVCSAQTVLDTAYLKCYYTYSWIKDTTKIQRQISNEMTLLIGEKTSKFYSYPDFRYDSVVATGVSMLIETVINNVVYVSENPKYSEFQLVIGSGFKVYKNYHENKVIFTDCIQGNLHYVYEEESPTQDWKIQQNTAIISGYKCQKAICRFRGRDYVAWFTNEIPINNGPYKFGGLPGLIVQINDTKSHYNFQLTRIEKIQEPILFEKRDYKKINRKDYIRIYRNHTRHMEEIMNEDNQENSSATPAYVWNNDAIEIE